MTVPLFPPSPPTLLHSLVRQLAEGLDPAHEPARPVPQQHLEADWHRWLTTLFGSYISTFAPFHEELWEWLWSIPRDARPPAFVGIWARGAGKSTNAELATVAVGALGKRRYGLYVCEIQDQADDHVSNIAAMLESSKLEAFYPALGERLLSKFGPAKGWRRNRLRTASGFTIDAIGLDSAARGAKMDEDRPGWMVFDDLDDEHDSLPAVTKKIRTLTRALLPAGAPNLAVLAIQNLIHPDSIFSQLVDGRADFLTNRILSGPHPALRNAAIELMDGRLRVLAGEPTWDGQDAAACEALLADIGLTAFMAECQHAVEKPAGGLFNHLHFEHCAWDTMPALVRTVVWVDPAVTDTDQSDANGIQADGLGTDGRIYRLWSWEQRASPEVTLRAALLKAVELGADTLGIETDQGGDVWFPAARSVIRDLQDEGGISQQQLLPRIRSAKAGQGHGPKTHRASLQLADYERGRFVHAVGTHATLEAALKRFPAAKPYDLVDASYYSWADLTGRLPEEDTGPTVLPVIVGAGGGRVR